MFDAGIAIDDIEFLDCEMPRPESGECGEAKPFQCNNKVNKFCQNPAQVQLTTPTNSNWWMTVGFDFFMMSRQQQPSPKKNQLLHYVGRWNLVCELNIAQLEEIWSKNS